MTLTKRMYFTETRMKILKQQDQKKTIKENDCHSEIEIDGIKKSVVCWNYESCENSPFEK